MKKVASVLLILVLMCTLVTSCGKKAPNFTVLDGNGNEVTLRDFRGKGVVLNFWASWCPPCKAEMPDFEQAYKEYGDRVQFLMVNLTMGNETMSSAKSFISQMGYTFPVYYDVYGMASDAYDIQSIPQTYFISKRGEIEAYATQMIKKEDLYQAIDVILED